jgi:hypothetical protein
MEERKKYELLVFLTIYVIFIALMVPVGVKAPKIFMGFLKARYGEAVRTTGPGAAQSPQPSSAHSGILVVIAGATVLSLAAYYGRRAYRKMTRRDYRVARNGRAECSGKLAQRPSCRHYRATPSTECIHFLGTADQGMCVRQVHRKRGSARARSGRPW